MTRYQYPLCNSLQWQLFRNPYNFFSICPVQYRIMELTPWLKINNFGQCSDMNLNMSKKSYNILKLERLEI